MLPSTIEKFQEWVFTKRAVDLETLKTKIQDMLMVIKANIIRLSQGWHVEEITSIYYDNETMLKNTVECEIMLNKFINLKHTYTKEIIEQYHVLIKEKNCDQWHR